MSSSFLEIVELANGDVALQRAEEDGEPLVVIQFSEESRVYLMDSSLEVARVMIQAGIQAAASMAEHEGLELEEADEVPRTVH
ncbi:hypothetical protein EYC98_11220 [Halieaceae bacterium IMCC14734]|uniref:Uncharacterized protein n=1 Tax=Candidatus Litorirhabdus singularis TaxID=2518993 RepID=A0ABT3TGJ1_9GAMM|nr:hypothetical protein [Candidatus Litorirhabdus singularis]MCX2981433.1 hypothetical protein [Candidatus Litorirhabdus singularis]